MGPEAASAIKFFLSHLVSEIMNQWRLVFEFAGGAASHFLIFLHSLWAVYLPLFSYKCANFPKLCAVLVVHYICIQSGIALAEYYGLR